jgi:hypothetical protein
MTELPTACLAVAKDREFLGIFLDIFAVLLTLEALVFLCARCCLAGERNQNERNHRLATGGFHVPLWRRL